MNNLSSLNASPIHADDNGDAPMAYKQHAVQIVILLRPETAKALELDRALRLFEQVAAEMDAE